MIGHHVIYAPEIDELFVVEIEGQTGAILECRLGLEINPDSFNTLEWVYIGPL